MTKVVIDIQETKEFCQGYIDNLTTVEEVNELLEHCYKDVAANLMYCLIISNMQPNPQQAMSMLDSLLNEVYYTGSNTHISKSFTIH